MSKAFPDAVYNIGGDEMNNACWNQSAGVARFMRAKKLNGSQLTAYFAKRLFGVVEDRQAVLLSVFSFRPTSVSLTFPICTMSLKILNPVHGCAVWITRH